MSRYKELKLFISNYEREETNVISSSNIFSTIASPPANDILKIQLDGKFAREKFQEAIAVSIWTQGTNVTARTWKRMIRFLEQENTYWDCRNNQIKLEVLLIVVKVNHKEYYSRQLELESTADMAISQSVSTMLSNMVANLMSANLVFDNIELSEGGMTTAVEIKQFLMKPAIVQAIINSLGKVFEKNSLSLDWIREHINAMNIYTTAYLPPLYGASLTDGILLIPNSNLIMFPEWPKHRQAALLTLAVHESSHYLARYYANDFNFSSPFSFRGGNQFGGDPIILHKPLELGRATELELFGCQPLWNWPKNDYGPDGKIAEAAAVEFFNRVAVMSTSLPVFTKAELKLFKIKEREFPSLSLGAELLFNVGDGLMID